MLSGFSLPNTKAPQAKVDLSNYPLLIQPNYRPMLNNRSRYLVLVGGAGSGKSYFIAQKILYRCLAEKSSTHIVARKFGSTHRTSTFPLLKNQIDSIGWKNYVQINKSDLSISFRAPFCSKIYFVGLDDAEKLKSFVDVSSIWIEEASEINQSDFQQLDLRLRGKSPYHQIILSSNPVGGTRSWIYQEFYKKINQSASVFNPVVYDNIYINPEYIQNLERLAVENPELGKIYLEGQFIDLSGQIFNNYDIIQEMPKKIEKHYIGIDFGFQDPTVVVRMGIIGKDLYVDELLYQSNLSNNELIERLKTFNIRDREKMVADSAEPSRIADIRKAGFNIEASKKGQNSIIEGINLLKSYRIHVTESSNNILDELQSYCWKKDRNNISLDEPIGYYDHSIAAMRYVMFTLFSKTSTFDTNRPLMMDLGFTKPQQRKIF